MFCDIAGSTRLSEQLDPEDLLTLVRRYQAMGAEIIEGLGGSIAQYLGDGLLAYFGHPTAYENAPERAARAGLAILEGLGPLNEGLRRDFSTTLELRLGIHTGMVVIGELGGGAKREQLAVGDTANIAARLQGLAPVDTGVISEATRQLIEGVFETEPLGLQALEGIANPVATHRLVGLSAARHRQERLERSPFVGRTHELGVLRQRWNQARAGHGSATLVTADAGVGKSRLVVALLDALGADRFALHEAYCSPFFSHSALRPIIEMLRAELELDHGEPASRALDGLRAWTAPHPEALPLLAHLLEIPAAAGYDDVVLLPQARHQRTTESLLRCLLPDDGDAPVLLVLEDVHWVDPSTSDLLGRLIERLPDRRMMLVMTARPLDPPWHGAAHVHSLPLHPFDAQDTRALILEMTKDLRLSTAMIDQLVARTDGVALFVEEMTRMLLGHPEQTSISSIPTTLRDSLAARLDRVEPRTRELAQLGATIGREFDRALLRRIFPGEDADVQRGLDDLVAAQLIHPLGAGPGSRSPRPSERYAFEHTLIQEAAYESLLKRTRQEYHGRIADALQEGLDPAADAVVLAQHLEAAGRERHEEAARQWLKAGIAAHVRASDLDMFDYVPREAIDRLRRGLKLVISLPRTPSRVRLEVRLLSKLGASLNAIQGYAATEVEQIYTRAHGLCDLLEQGPERFWLLWRVWAFHVVKGRHLEAVGVARQLLESAHEQRDRALELEAGFAAGLSLFFTGDDLEGARQHLEGVVSHYDRELHHVNVSISRQDVGVTSSCVLALLHFQLGNFELAMQSYERALMLSEQLGHPFTRAYALGCAAWFQLHCRNFPMAEQHARESVAVSEEHGFAWWLIWGDILGGRAGVERRDPDAGARIERALEQWRAAGSSFNVPRFLSLLAEARLAAGELEAAASLLEEARALAETTTERFFLAELLRLQGQLHLARAAADEPAFAAAQDAAESSFRAAMAAARAQGARAWELRAAIALAQLLQQRGQPSQARALLTQAHASFEHDPSRARHPDARDARALLHALDPSAHPPGAT